MIRTLGLLAILIVLWGWPSGLAAQEAPAGSDATELEALAAELRDEGKRADLIRRIEALAAAQRGTAPAEEEPARGPLASVTDSIVAFGGDVAGSFSFAFDPGVFRQWLEQASGIPQAARRSGPCSARRCWPCLRRWLSRSRCGVSWRACAGGRSGWRPGPSAEDCSRRPPASCSGPCRSRRLRLPASLRFPSWRCRKRRRNWSSPLSM